MKLIHSLFVLMITSISSAHAYFYGALAMKNPETKKIVILIADFHENINKDVIKEQARDFRNATVELQKDRGKDSVYVIAEDQAHFLTGKTNKTYPIKIPLDHIVTRSRAAGIPAINVEFRDGTETQDTTQPIQEIIENTKDETVISRVKQHYEHQIKHKLVTDFIYLDVAIINALRNSNAPYIFIAAGANHIASVSKILYQDGYTDVVMQVGDSVVGCYKEFLYCYNTMEAIRRFEPSKIPEPLPAVKDAILQLVATLEKSGTEK